MFFYLGVLCLSVCVFLFFLAVIGTRNPKKPRWTNDMVMSCIITPVIVSLTAMGFAGIVQSLVPGNRPSAVDMAIGGAIVAVSVALYYLLGIGKKMARYGEEYDSGEVISADFSIKRDGNDEGPVSGSPSLRKAA